MFAHRQRQRWDRTGTLNTTALVHEAYLKLVNQRRIDTATPEHFFALAATAIRHIISNYARDRRAGKRGAAVRKISLSELGVDPPGSLSVSEEQLDVLVGIDDALERLDRINPRQRGIVECRFFGGMTAEETAAAMGISPRTVKRDWAVAQAWLYRELRDGSDARWTSPKRSDSELFEFALTLPLGDRRRYARDACSDDRTCAPAGVSLLAAYEEAPDYLERIAHLLQPAAFTPTHSFERPESERPIENVRLFASGSDSTLRDWARLRPWRDERGLGGGGPRYRAPCRAEDPGLDAPRCR